MLSFGINTRCGFVQNQDSRIVRESARKREQLFLADGKGGAALPDGFVQTLRKALDEIQNINPARRLFHLSIAYPTGSQSNVAADGSGKQERVLQDYSEIAAQVAQPELADIDSIEQYLALLDVIEAQQQIGER